MKKLLPFFFVLVLASVSQAQILKLDTFMYSPSLDTVKMVDVILPPGYNQNPDLYYPVVYYLHGWTGDQNSNVSIISYMYSFINNGTVDPFILVKPSSDCEPFEGSYYVNSPLWGNYQDYVTSDLIAWVDSSFRTIPDKEYRGLLGQSMGSAGCLLLTIAHPEYYRAAAGHAGGGSYYHYDSLVEASVASWFTSSPPYAYAYNNSNSSMRAFFLLSGAFTPNLNSPQTYISPAIVDYPFDEYGHIIDSTWEKFQQSAPEITVSQLDPSDSVSFLISCGTLDDFKQFDPLLDLVDTMLAHNLDVEWLPHTGDHSMPTLFKTRSLIWLDSILGDPQIITGQRELQISSPTINVFPNPSRGELSIEIRSKKTEKLTAEVFDMEGRLVCTLFTEETINGTFRRNTDIRELCSGTYLLHLKLENRHIYEKLVKQ